MFQQRGASLLLALVLCTCMLCNVVNSRVIRLNGWVGVDNATCLEGASNVSCRSLEFIAEGVQNNCSNVTIWIESKGIELQEEVDFHNCYNLSIASEQPIHVQCMNRRNSSFGFLFENITELWVRNLHFNSCRSSFRSCSAAAVQIHDSTDVRLENLHFVNSIGTAMVFVNTFGLVSMTNSSFKHNKFIKRRICSYPGGVYIEFTENSAGAVYTIRNCSFVRNLAPFKFLMYSPSEIVPAGDWRGLGFGGGLAILFMDLSNSIEVSILNCNFTGNWAAWGGGMYVHYQGKAVNNIVLINGTHFEANKAEQEGGGIEIGILQDSPSHNRLLLTNCTFYNNTAIVGGGTSLFAVYGTVKPEPGDSVVFQNCTWRENRGKLGSAIDIVPSNRDRIKQGFLPIVILKDCRFVANYPYIRGAAPSRPIHVEYSGVFTVKRATIVFQGVTVFNSNKYTALHATSSQVVFEKQSKVEFQNNIGSKGAAIAMYGFSTLVFSEDSSFEFTNNSAIRAGGAIYYETFDQHDFAYSRSCFLQYNGSNLTVEERNVSFTFAGNDAAEAGTSIYSSSFYPCYFEHFDDIGVENNIAKFFWAIANFTFNDQNDSHIAESSNEGLNGSLAADGKRFKTNITWSKRIAAIPGKKIHFGLNLSDEFGQIRKTAYAFSVKTNASQVAVDPKYTVGTSARFYGHVTEDFTFLVSAHNLGRITAAINMSFLPCPPGYYFANDSMSCKCAAYDSSKAFDGITICNSAAYVAYIQYGYWGGYDSSKKFYTALCPLTFCALTTNASNPQLIHALPNSSSALNNVMCGNSRKGILCGECQENNSAHYHSSHFKCKPNRLCEIGFFFYVLSELVPTVILFSLIIAFDISFTNGTMNGFILFCQVLDTITLNMRLTIEKIERATRFFNIFYGILNLDFFDFEPLSFCLWEGATVMDVVTFKYVTVVFALVLVIGLILLMNSRLCSKIHKKGSQKLSIIHGLSAFLVICYTQCTKISFYILTRVVLEGEGGTSGPVVTFFGGIPYFKGKHLIYVFPAIFCLVTITILPPLLLFLYPLLYQLLSLCGLSEHYIVTKISNVLSIHKMMPIFDSFQSCYKDKLRFFAGLYFIYRIAILAAHSGSHSATQFHVLNGFLLFFIMGIHSFTNPYKNTTHNRIDSLLFLDLALINAIMLLSIVFAVETRENPGLLNRNTVLTVISMFQMILILLPIVSFTSWLMFMAIRKCGRYLRNRNTTDNNIQDNNFEDFSVNRDLGESDPDTSGSSQYFRLNSQ